MEYNFRDIEKKWREYWIANKVYQVEINEKPNGSGIACRASARLHCF